MKRFSFLSVVIAAVLLVTAVSCTTMAGADDGYYERRPTSDRVYVDDPYRGVVVLERDPYSGRYYEVDSYGSYYGSRYYNNYGGRYNTYSRDNDRYRNYRSNSRVTQQPTRQPSQEEIREREKNRDEARKKVLGN